MKSAPAKTTLTPKLRFPEFRDGPGWKEKQLKNICDLNPSHDGLPDRFFYIDLESVELGVLKAKRLLSKDDAPSRAQRVLKEGDVIFQIVRPYQRNNLLVNFCDSHPFIASTGYAQLRAHSSEKFLYHAIHTDHFAEQVLAQCTGSSYPAINSSDLAEIHLTIPSPAEQNKIADCLSSLDELIKAESQKLDALKTHKKGLMQQLFPREGETVPRLRFREFRKNGDWKERPLGSFIEEFCEKSSTQDEYEVLTSARHGLVRQRDYYDNDRISERDNIGFNVIPPNYLTYRSRSDNRQFYFNENNLGFTGIVSVYYPVFRVIDGSNKFFIELLSSHSTLVGKYSVGTSQTVLSLTQLGRIKLPIPSEAEQHRIGSCLSSLDDLIAAQRDELDALKTHKKGLMQQLFPAPEEAKV